MYFNAETQARILARFHFALADDGVLFLGKAEMLLTQSHCSRRSTCKLPHLPKIRKRPLARAARLA